MTISTPRLDSLTAGGTNRVFENEEAPQESPEEADESETAEALVTRALAEWGISTHQDDEVGNTWLVIGYDQNCRDFPDMSEPYVVLYLYNITDGEEITVERAPVSNDEWTVVVGDGTGAEGVLLKRPSDRLTECVEAIAEWATTPQVSPDPLIHMSPLRGTFESGYSADAIRWTFGGIEKAGGPRLICVWDYADEYGFGGASEFFAEDENGNLFEIQPDIYRWLSGQQATPCPVDTWVCAPVTGRPEFPVSDDFHNYARTDRTGD